MRARIAPSLGCVLVLLLLIAVPGATPSAASPASNVNLALDWVINGTHAGYFAAAANGYYRDLGLNVTISRGYGSGDTVKRVASGVATFGIADTGTFIAARANDDVPVRIVAMVYQKSTLGVIYLKQSGISAPKNLEGRTIARSAAGASVTLWPAFLAANGVDRNKIHELVVDGTEFLPLLLSRKVDAVLDQSVNLGHYAVPAARQGLTAMAMRYADYGLVTYGNAIIVAQQTMASRPDVVRRFVAASLKGVAYAFARPDEAIAVIRRSNPEIDAQGAKDELVAMRDVSITTEVRQDGLGVITPQRMTATRDVVDHALHLQRTVPIGELYTTEFLPKPPIMPAH